MIEPSLLHNCRARGDCSHRISSYPLRDTQLDEEEMDLSLDVNDTDEDESEEYIMHETFDETTPKIYL